MTVVGADGCKAGWFAIALTEGGDFELDVFPDVSSLWEKHSGAVVLIDIPIGLRESGPQERLCDTEARKLLGPPRASSVFAAPCRPALYTKTYKEGGDINEEMTGRRLSHQTWNIISKIREVDEFLSNNKAAKSHVREVHPEVCFWALAGGRPMEHKKDKEEGFRERTQVLHSVYQLSNEIVHEALTRYARSRVKKDDILDALSAAVTAKLGSHEGLVSIPETPEFDSQGLRMEMVYTLTVV